MQTTNIIREKEPLATIPSYPFLLQKYYKDNCEKCRNDSKIVHFHEHMLYNDFNSNYTIWRDGVRILTSIVCFDKEETIGLLDNIKNELIFDSME